MSNTTFIENQEINMQTINFLNNSLINLFNIVIIYLLY